LHRIQGDLSAICEDALGFGYGRVDHEVGQCRIRRRGGLPDELVSLARNAKVPALGPWHAVTMHMPISIVTHQIGARLKLRSSADRDAEPR